MGRIMEKMLLFMFVCVTLAFAHSLDSERLAEFERKLDNAGLDLIDKMYDDHENRIRREVPTPTDSDIKQITDTSVHHRSRRSVILDQVKAARKTGNREELFLRSSIPYKKLLQIYDPTDIVPIAITLDRPYNTMVKPKFFAVANYRNALGKYDSAVIILRYNETTDNFTVHQFLNEYAPYELESFSGKINAVAHKNFLSVSGFILDPDQSDDFNPRVSIYEISPPPYFVFSKMQEYRLNTVRAMKYTQIGQTTFLILGMYYQMTRYGKQYSSPSQLLILRYDVASNLFHFHSSLPGSGVTDIECFTVRGDTYLTVANYRDNVGRLGILSFIYLYNEQIRGFEMMQYLSTNGARDIEPFTLANEKYLVVANEATGSADNKTLDVDSDVYKLSNGRFELIQKLSTYGAVKWKGIAVPNCKQDVLLVYSDQRNDVDQVGIYTFSHDQEMFSVDQFSIYHLDLLNSTFRPMARALSAYSLQDKDTGEFSLYLIVGATDISEGNTIYKLTYEVILTDSPLDAFKRNVEVELNSLKEALDAVKALLAKAKVTLNDAVTRTGNDTITGTKVIFQNMYAEHAFINRLNITEGSMLFLKGNKTYETDPSAAGANLSYSALEASIMKHNSTVNSILDQEGKFMYVNVDQNITSNVTFNKLDVADVTVTGDLAVTSNVINNVNLSEIQDVVLKNEPGNVTGYKKFVNRVNTSDVVVDGKVNGINFDTDLVVQGVDQIITASKVFTTSVNITKTLNANTINGDDISDALFINRPGVVNGTNTFMSDITSKNITVDIVNGLDIQNVLIDRVTKSTVQSISGHKTFEKVMSNGNVDINGTINGINLRDLKKKLESQGNVSVISGDKVFLGNITVTGNVTIEKDINGMEFPDDVLLKTSTKTVLAEKIFRNNVTFNVVRVGRSIDGLDFDDAVTLDTDQDIDGLKTFESVSFSNNINIPENHTVNGMDVSTFVKGVVSTTEDEHLAHLTFEDAVIMRNATVGNLINNETLATLTDVMESCLHLRRDQNITNSIRIMNNITVAKNMTTQYINNFTYPGDFASTLGNQTLNGDKTFEDDIVMDGATVNGTVNGIDLDKFNNDIVTDRDGVIYGDKTVTGNVFINGTLSSEGKINGLNFTENLVFYTTDQDITAKKHFNVLNFSDFEVNIQGDVNVGTTIDGVDLSELELSGMTVSKNETITGTKCFAHTDYNRSVELLNDVDLSALRDDIVTVNTDQVIRSEKVFKNMALNRNLNTTSTIDGVDVSELRKQMVLSNQDSTIIGSVTFNRSLIVNGNLTAKEIDGVDMENIRTEFVSLSGNETLSNLTVIGSVTAKNMDVNTINDIAVEDFVYRSSYQVISGVKQFGDVTVGNLSVGSGINGVNLTSLRNEVIFKDEKNQTIVGEKNFMDDVNIEGSLNTNGRINDIDLRNWDIARTSGDKPQNVTGIKSFTSHTTIDHLTTTGTVNGGNITKLFDEAVMLNENYTLDHVTFQSGLTVEDVLSVDGDVTMLGLLNGINLNSFDTEVLKTVGDQDLTSKTINGDTSTLFLNTTGLVNGLNISRDLVTKRTSQEIRGAKDFNSIEFLGDVSVKKTVGGVNLTELATNTLLKRTDNTQIISGHKTFHNVTMDEVRCHGYVDGLNVSRSTFVTLHTKQIIHGVKNFTGDFISNRTNVAGRVAGVDLVNFNRSRVLLSGDQIITSDIMLTDNVTIDKNLIISGLVNNIDVSEFNLSSPNLNETEIGNIQTKLSNSLSNQCQSLKYVKNSLSASAYQLDYFVERQSIRGESIQHSEFFSIGNNSFLALSVTRSKVTHCTNSMIKRWNVTNMLTYQRIPTSGAMKMVFFRTPWDDSYLLVVNSKPGCAIEGPSELLKWNSTTSRFQLATPLPTINAVDATVHTESDRVIIFVSNSDNTLSSWLLMSSGIVPYSTLDDYPVAGHVFNIDDIPYLAVASRSEETSSRGFVNIYKIMKGNMTRVQSIATKGASSITSFDVKGVKYLVVANDRAYSASGLSTYHLSTDIYSYSEKNLFEWFRSIPTYRAYRVGTYEIGSFTYLTITHFDQSVSIYHFGLELGFQKVEQLPLDGIRGLTYITNEEKRYVFLSSAPEVSYGVSKLMELNPSGPDQRKVEKTIAC